VVSVLDF